MHPSLLPHYRGPAPIQHALLNGEKESGVCVIEMLNVKAGAVDSGDIWGCEKMVREQPIDLAKKLQPPLANPRRGHLPPIT